MFICKYCNKSNNVDLLNVLIDQINLILEMLKESLKTNFQNNEDIYEKCLSIINLFREVPCNYKQIIKDLPENKIEFLDKETQYYNEENSSLINAEEIKTVAGNFVNNSNFIYDERIDMYYDSSACYYYDAEKSLYYDASNGSYYFYDINSNSYLYHSQIDSTKYATIYHIIYESNISKSKTKKLCNKSNTSKNHFVNTNSPILIEDSSVSSNMEVNLNLNDNDNCKKLEINSFNVNLTPTMNENIQTKTFEDILDKHKIQNDENMIIQPPENEIEEGEIADVDSVPPELFNCVPCIRMIVKDSNQLKINSLFIITCTGATIGREASLNHLIQIYDPLVSKMHCSISYQNDINRYVIQDHASQSGTFINRKRIGESKCISDPFKLYHEDELTIGSTSFILHIHPRNDTCNACEPGNLVVKDPKKEETNSNIFDRKTQLNNLKKKYGLKNSKYEAPKKFAPNYVDRSQIRRLINPSEGIHTNYEDESASIDRPIQSDNVGHRLLKNMGWKEGQGLGAKAEGITEPVKTELRINEVAGLGSNETCNISLDNLSHTRKKKNWLKTKQRFDNIYN